MATYSSCPFSELFFIFPGMAPYAMPPSIATIALKLFLFILLGLTLGGSFVLLKEQAVLWLRKKAFQRKLLEQTSGPVLIGLVLTLILQAYIAFQSSEQATCAEPYSMLPLLAAGGGVLSCGVLVCMRLLWKKRAKSYLPGLLLGLILGAAAATSTFAFAGTAIFSEASLAVKKILGTCSGSGFMETTAALPDIMVPVLWGAGILLLVLFVPLGYSALMVWVCLRRSKDDFGRDYYSYTLRRLAFMSLLTSLCAAIIIGLCMAHLCGTIDGLTEKSMLGLVVTSILWCTAMVNWGILVYAQNPLRHRLGAALAFCALLASCVTSGWVFLTACA